MRPVQEITLTINGDQISCPSGTTLRGYLAAIGLGQNRVVAELNGRIIKFEDLDQHVLQEGDQVEFVRFVGGG